jgi:hypothetical protein
VEGFLNTGGVAVAEAVLDEDVVADGDRVIRR